MITQGLCGSLVLGQCVERSPSARSRSCDTHGDFKIRRSSKRLAMSKSLAFISSSTAAEKVPHQKSDSSKELLCLENDGPLTAGQVPQQNQDVEGKKLTPA